MRPCLVGSEERSVLIREGVRGGGHGGNPCSCHPVEVSREVGTYEQIPIGTATTTNIEYDFIEGRSSRVVDGAADGARSPAVDPAGWRALHHQQRQRGTAAVLESVLTMVCFCVAAYGRPAAISWVSLRGVGEWQLGSRGYYWPVILCP
jgi:hypothetical protein